MLDLDEIREGLKVILDQPKWFMREGQLAINLFLGEVRIYSLVFSLFRTQKALPPLSAQYKDVTSREFWTNTGILTKAAHGMRPRDLLIEVFRMFCGALGVATHLCSCRRISAAPQRLLWSGMPIKNLI